MVLVAFQASDRFKGWPKRVLSKLSTVKIFQYHYAGGGLNASLKTIHIMGEHLGRKDINLGQNKKK